MMKKEGNDKHVPNKIARYEMITTTATMTTRRNEEEEEEGEEVTPLWDNTNDATQITSEFGSSYLVQSIDTHLIHSISDL